jgi:hypothetical protein
MRMRKMNLKNYPFKASLKFFHLTIVEQKMTDCYLSNTTLLFLLCQANKKSRLCNLVWCLIFMLRNSQINMKHDFENPLQLPTLYKM